MPNEELKQLLKQNLEVSEESLKILKKLNKSRRMGSLFFVFKWLIIIGLAIGAFYYLEPYINQIKTMYSQVQDLQKIMPK